MVVVVGINRTTLTLITNIRNVISQSLTFIFLTRRWYIHKWNRFKGANNRGPFFKYRFLHVSERNNNNFQMRQSREGICFHLLMVIRGRDVVEGDLSTWTRLQTKMVGSSSALVSNPAKRNTKYRVSVTKPSVG